MVTIVGVYIDTTVQGLVDPEPLQRNKRRLSVSIIHQAGRRLKHRFPRIDSYSRSSISKEALRVRLKWFPLRPLRLAAVSDSQVIPVRKEINTKPKYREEFIISLLVFRCWHQPWWIKFKMKQSRLASESREPGPTNWVCLWSRFPSEQRGSGAPLFT